ncbi:MAG: hypothetical protein M3R11_09025 [Acidobacteriota bacterium]|nr:hypothetical protein [Acidobacteriota bacterium]
MTFKAHKCSDTKPPHNPALATVCKPFRLTLMCRFALDEKSALESLELFRNTGFLEENSE